MYRIYNFLLVSGVEYILLSFCLQSFPIYIYTHTGICTYILLSIFFLIMVYHVLSHFSPVPLFVTPWIVARQVPLYTGFSRQEYWRGLPFPSPGIVFILLRDLKLKNSKLWKTLKLFLKGHIKSSSSSRITVYYSPFDADEHGVNKLSGEKCCLLKLAAVGAPPRGAPGPYIWPPERFEAKFPKCVEEGVTEPYGESILTIPTM